MSAAPGGLESPAVWPSGAVVVLVAVAGRPTTRPAATLARSKSRACLGRRGNGSRLLNGFQPDLRAGIRSRSLRAPRPHTLILKRALARDGEPRQALVARDV